MCEWYKIIWTETENLHINFMVLSSFVFFLNSKWKYLHICLHTRYFDSLCFSFSNSSIFSLLRHSYKEPHIYNVSQAFICFLLNGNWKDTSKKRCLGTMLESTYNRLTRDHITWVTVEVCGSLLVYLFCQVLNSYAKKLMSKAFFEGSNKKYIYKEQNLLTLQLFCYSIPENLHKT